MSVSRKKCLPFTASVAAISLNSCSVMAALMLVSRVILDLHAEELEKIITIKHKQAWNHTLESGEWNVLF